MSHKRKRALKRWSRFGDVGRGVLMTTAGILPELPGARKPRVSVGLSLLAVKLVVTALKKLFPEERPNGEDDQSFPSEHAAECVASALIIGRECPGVPAAAAYGLASAVALSRIAARKHHPRDVAAGAAIGALAVWSVTRLRTAVGRKVRSPATGEG
jgi:membrane-associated phospholipid phosphatase